VQQENRWRQIFADHEQAPYAHAQAFAEMDRRMSELEKLGWQIRGGLAVLMAGITGGLLVVVAHAMHFV
jgi:hypothetical protein